MDATFRLPATRRAMINLIDHQIYASWTGKGGRYAETTKTYRKVGEKRPAS